MRAGVERARVLAVVCLVAVAAGCTTSPPATQSIDTTGEPSEREPSTTIVTTEAAQATTEEGYLLPPGEGLTTTSAPLVTVFDERSICDNAATDLDVLRMQAFVAAYNLRDSAALLQVLQPSDLFDVTAIPHVGSALSKDPLAWAQAGWDVDDQIQLVEVRTYSGAGADGLLRRRNQLLEDAGIGWLTYSFKVQGRGCVIINFVASGPRLEEGGCDFYAAFAEQLRAAEIPTRDECDI